MEKIKIHQLNYVNKKYRLGRLGFRPKKYIFYPKVYYAEEIFRKKDETRKDCLIPSDLVAKCPVCGGKMTMHLRCECLDILNNIENYFDIILMDIQMPDMDGYETTKHIRRFNNKWADIPIIAMTANAFEAEMNGHIVKPLNINEIIKTLKSINDI